MTYQASQLKPFVTYQDELTYRDGLILKGGCIVIPESHKAEMLKRIHEPHMGIVKSKQLARDIIFWPGMSSQIEDMVSRCATCQSSSKLPPAEPMIPHDIPSIPWAKVASDLFVYKGRNYLLSVDYYSKFPDMYLLPNTCSQSVISATKSMFARFGIPKEVVTDNGPQFSSHEYAYFAKQWGFCHTTSSPGYAQANGQIERTVQTVKEMIKKCEETGHDPYIALLNFRNTPVDTVNKSPAQLLQSRRLASKLPVTEELLKPEVVENAHAKLRQRQMTQKYYYDIRASTTKHAFQPGHNVRLRTLKGEWKYGTIQNKCQNVPRSYIIETPEGKLFRRNRRHAFETREATPTTPRDQNMRIDINSSDNHMSDLSKPYIHVENSFSTNKNDNLHDTKQPDNYDNSELKPTANTTETKVFTRSGRLSKPPRKLDL
uniref:Uncharacterized protein K02A2.6-like n=1 Tax=Saccoglossus kowalevskii TaxID=10224 RepID=A0ABM0M5S7_SACKO|nr:PREDICTED: uncharacterized protein K02A2.6-like [Saccoglossus kowalevskii]